MQVRPVVRSIARFVGDEKGYIFDLSFCDDLKLNSVHTAILQLPM